MTTVTVCDVPDRREEWRERRLVRPVGGRRADWRDRQVVTSFSHNCQNISYSFKSIYKILI